MSLNKIVNLKQYPIDQLDGFGNECKLQLDQSGSLLLPNFVSDDSIEILKQEALAYAHLAYYCQQSHTAYLSASDKKYDANHTRNRKVNSSKGCITDDQIPENSILRIIYSDEKFQSFLCHVLGERQLFSYTDNLSSVNVHYYEKGQELGWHFDNSSFAVTLMVQPSDRGGDFEYIPQFRDFDNNDMNFDGVGKALDGDLDGVRLSIAAGTLALFRGKNSLHRVTPVTGDINRIQVVLAYNTEPGVALSEQARLTFYGRTN